jgi:hypothetical protein
VNLRKAAFLTFITGAVSLPWPLWNAINRVLALGVARSHWFVLPVTLFVICLTAMMPAFYFALFRDAGPMRFSRGLRKLALLAAVALCIVAGIRASAGLHVTWYAVPGLLSGACYVLLLITMSRENSEETARETPPSDLLVSLTKLTVVVWGLWVAFQFVRIAFVVFTYSQLQQNAFQVRRAPPSFGEMVVDVVLAFVSQANLLAAPYIVWRSDFGRWAVPLQDEIR